MRSLPSLRRSRTLLIALGVALSAWLLAPAAVAHDVLISSTPEEGEVLTEPPQQVTLTFNNPPLDVGAALVIEDADGATVAQGEGVVAGTDVQLEIPEELPGGEYAVVWRVASSDGHPIDGRIPFSVEAAESPAEPTTEPATAATEATTEPVTETTTEATTVVAEPADTASAQEAEEGSGPATWLIVLIAVVALGSIAALVVAAVRRQRDAR